MGETLRTLVSFVCPFCGAVASAVEQESGEPGIVHPVPMCVRFEAMEPDEYMRAVNAATLGPPTEN